MRPIAKSLTRPLLRGARQRECAPPPPRRVRHPLPPPAQVEVDLSSAVPHRLRVEFRKKEDCPLCGLRIGHLPPQPADLLQRAVLSAQEADGVLLCVGLGGDFEGEGQVVPVVLCRCRGRGRVRRGGRGGGGGVHGGPGAVAGGAAGPCGFPGTTPGNGTAAPMCGGGVLVIHAPPPPT